MNKLLLTFFFVVTMFSGCIETDVEIEFLDLKYYEHNTLPRINEKITLDDLIDASGEYVVIKFDMNHSIHDLYFESGEVDSVWLVAMYCDSDFELAIEQPYLIIDGEKEESIVEVSSNIYYFTLYLNSDKYGADIGYNLLDDFEDVCFKIELSNAFSMGTKDSNVIKVSKDSIRDTVLNGWVENDF